MKKLTKKEQQETPALKIEVLPVEDAKGIHQFVVQVNCMYGNQEANTTNTISSQQLMGAQGDGGSRLAHAATIAQFIHSVVLREMVGQEKFFEPEVAITQPPGNVTPERN